jgi:dTDP-D-glucose 4,6-dehydratase
MIKDEDRPFNDKRYFIDNYKLKSLGWKIKCSFDTEINKLV